MVKQISIKEALKLDCTFVDVRAPIEFEEDHIPKAISLPLLSDEQRAIVGTLYKQKSSGEAYAKGFEYIMPKAKSLHDSLMNIKKPIIVYCWRGGLRSKIIVSLVEAEREDVYQLKGGHKSYREYVRTTLEKYKLNQKVFVLNGYSCVNKTKILNELPNAIDLEGLAQHRGSVFGAMGLKPRTQKMFESLLLQRLNELENEKFIVLEGESAKIGDLHVPKFLFSKMQKGINILIKMPVEERMRIFIEEYKIFDKKEEFLRILKGLEKRVGKKNVEEIEKLLLLDDLIGACRILFEKYYDPLYDYSLKKLNFAFVVEKDYVKNIKSFLKK